MTARIARLRVQVASSSGELAGIIDCPRQDKPHRAAIFAPCFTCGKDSLAAARVGTGLAASGFAMLRLDFTGLGESAGQFADTNLSTQIADLKAADLFMQRRGHPPALLIGHSLGGIAALFAALELSHIQAVALINAPPRADHLLAHIADYLPEIEAHGMAMVPIDDPAGKRRFPIRRSLLDDLRGYSVADGLARLGRALLIAYGTADHLVTGAETDQLFALAREPKTLHLLPGVDHIVSNRDAGIGLGHFIAQWVGSATPQRD
jgi:putative redox protein